MSESFRDKLDHMDYEGGPAEILDVEGPGYWDGTPLELLARAVAEPLEAYKNAAHDAFDSEPYPTVEYDPEVDPF